MDGKPTKEFGKRHPVVASQSAAPVKRSSHVALLLMGTFAVGGGAYALMPRENCAPASPGMAAPAISQAGNDCSRRGSSWTGGHGGGGWSRSNFFSSDSASSSHGSSSSESGEGSITRGGFGSFARAFSGHFSTGS